MNTILNKTVPFITPIWRSIYPDFEQHRDLFTKTIKKFSESNPTIKRSNIGGSYQSPFSLVQEQGLSSLFDFVIDLGYSITKDLTMNSIRLGISGAWVNINSTRSASNISHNHEGILSGTFYLKMPPGSGKIYFNNPGINTLWEGFRFVEQRNEMTGELINITPVEGEVLIWPSFLHHGVLPNEHDDERISIAFNISGVPSYMFEDESSK